MRGRTITGIGHDKGVVLRFRYVHYPPIALVCSTTTDATQIPEFTQVPKFSSMDNVFDFVGGHQGLWKITTITAVTGDALEQAPYLNIIPASVAQPKDSCWTLTGVRSNLRYTERKEKEQLISVQSELGRPDATCAALIPIRKSANWWALAQDERRAIFEAQSRHITIGLHYLPAIARRLYHCRDLNEPFDFLTWFEYAPEHADAFERLVHELRQTEEWTYVDREVDIRLVKASAQPAP